MLAKNTRILHIDAWRLIAVSMVVVGHILYFSNPWYRENLPWIIVGRAHGLSLFGVKIFFVISGFVICRGLLSEQKSNGAISMKAFYIRRILRIVPPLLLYMLALEVLTFFEMIKVLPSQLMYAGLFLCNIYSERCGWHLGHTWSLAYEEQFYLFFPIIFVLSLVFGGRRTILTLTISMMCAFLVAAYAHFDQVAAAISTFIYMLAGCVAAMYWEALAPILKRISVFTWLCLVGATYMVGSLILWPENIDLVIKTILLPTLVCVMVLGTPVTSHRIASFFLNPTATYLGKISFTLYLWQQLATSPEDIHHPWINLVALAGTVIVAILSYRYLEQPLMRYGSALSKRFISSNPGAHLHSSTPVRATESNVDELKN